VTLAIHLQEGFRNDTVIIRVNGGEVYRENDVASRQLLGGLADDSLAVEVEAGLVEVEVDVPTQNLTATYNVNAAEYPYLGVYIEGGEIRFRRSKEAFGYG